MDLAQVVATFGTPGISLAQVCVLTYLALKVSDLDNALKGVVKVSRGVSKRLAFLFGHLRLDYDGGDDDV